VTRLYTIVSMRAAMSWVPTVTSATVTGSGASRVQIEHLATLLDRWLVRVSIDYCRYTGRGRADVQVFDCVDQVEELSTQFHHLCRGQVCTGALLVDIAANGGYRREAPQGCEDVDVSHITGVENVLRPSERRDGSLAEQPMRVRDDANQH